MPVSRRKQPLNDAPVPAPADTPDLLPPDSSPELSRETARLPVLGIDVAKATFRACLLPSGAARSLEADFHNTPEGFAALDLWLAANAAPRVRAGLEATGYYGNALLHHLHGRGHFVSLFNPRWIKDYARSEGRRNKTDAADARVIARYVRTHAARAWQPRTPAQETLQAFIRRRADVQRALISEQLRLPSACARMAPFIKRAIAHHKRELRDLEKAARALMATDADLDRRRALLESIPGIGRTTAMALLAEMPHLECFERVRDAAAWAGLTPALCESGTSVRGRSRMNRQGNGRLRKSLYMPALVLLRSKTANSLTRFRDRLREAGKPPMVIVGALMRKLFQTACGVLKHGESFNPSLA